MENQKMKTPKQMTITKIISNLILAIIAIALFKIAIDLSNFCKQQLRSQEEYHERSYSLMKKHYSHDVAYHLKEDGKKIAASRHFLDQLPLEKYKNGYPKNWDQLLEHGSEGIEAYLNLDTVVGRLNVIRGMESVAVADESHDFQMFAEDLIFNSRLENNIMNQLNHAVKDFFRSKPRSSHQAQELIMRSSLRSIENKQNSESGGVK